MTEKREKTDVVPAYERLLTMDTRDILRGGRSYGGTTAFGDSLKTMQELAAFEALKGMVTDLKVDQIERQARADSIKRGVTPVSVNPLEKFMEGMSNPDFLEKWNALTPDQQQRTLGAFQQMAMMANPMIGGMMMNPWFTNMMQPQRQEEKISAKDLVNVFTEGFKAAAQHQPQSDPIKTIEAVVALMTPMINKSSESDKKIFELQIEALKEKRGLKDIIGEIKDVVDTFGGGAASNVDIELAKIKADQSFQLAQLGIQARREAEAAKNEAMRTTGITQLAQSTLLGVGPAFAGVVEKFAEQRMGQPSQNDPLNYPPYKQPPSRIGAQAPASAKLVSATTDCAVCHKPIEFNYPENQPPKTIKCPHCQSVLDIGPEE